MTNLDDFKLILPLAGKPNYPPRGKIVEFMRAEWDLPMVCKWSELPEQMNCVGLYWRMK